MALFALRDISPGEELTYDYNFSLFNPAEGQVGVFCYTVHLLQMKLTVPFLAGMQMWQ